MKKSVPVAKQALQTPTGPGFESQVLHFFDIIIFQVIICTSKCAAHHAPSFNQFPDGHWPDLVAKR